MARKTQRPEVTDIEPPTGDFVLPDPSSFLSPKSDEMRTDPTRQPGRVVGLDYSQWAVAVLDLDDRPDRVADARRRYAAKGYQKMGGQPNVIGFQSAEVWVIPRDLYHARKQQRSEAIARAVRDGRMSVSAVSRPAITRGDGRG